MAEEQKIVHAKQAGPRNPLVLGLLSLLARLVGSLFRLGLRQLDVWRTLWIGKAHAWGWGGALVVIAAVALLAAIAAWMVRTIAPESTGSGIPYVESQLREGWIGNPFHIMWVKFVGGWMTIGGGLALGREGPTVQIGAVIGYILGGIFRRSERFPGTVAGPIKHGEGMVPSRAGGCLGIGGHRLRASNPGDHRAASPPKKNPRRVARGSHRSGSGSAGLVFAGTDWRRRQPHTASAQC